MADGSPRETDGLIGDVRFALTTLALAFAAMGAAAALKGLLLTTAHANAGFVIYVPALAVVAWYRGLLAGIVATLIGALADAALFVPALAILQASVDDLQLRLVAYFTGGVAVSYLSHRLRTERDRARVESGERRRALERAATMSDELHRRVTREQQQSELRDAFNSIVSHELRTPITAIYGGAKVLARRNRELDETTRQELIDDLEAEADRLYRLVEDLLVLSRSEYGTVERADEPVALTRVVERVARSEQARWPGVRFAVKAAPVPTARGDETYVEQVTRNLLSNAAKYSPAGSTVEVEIDEDAEGVRARVLDSGVGIKADEAERLFELYYRSPATAQMVGGAGIGLYACRALVDAMGGRIWAAARPGGGAEFGFALQRYAEDDAST
jgi:two-component system sensor histidine kinase KdpD